MSRDQDLIDEAQILRDKLTRAEDQLNAVQLALFYTTTKIHTVMKRLLTANDVKGDRAMRINILEQMNDLDRNIKGFFAEAGVAADASENNGRSPRLSD